MNLEATLRLIIAIAISELAGIIGSFFTVSAVDTWYAGIVKPAWNPPSWVFGPAWTLLYALMGIAVGLVWIRGDARGNGGIATDRGRAIMRGAFAMFSVQLVLNVAWSWLFFGLHELGWAFIELLSLWAAIVATIVVFSRISKVAAWLLVPYVLWVSFAGYLNYSLWALNKNSVMQTACTMEAKLCPDGSSVGRSGTNCEFAACPEMAVDPSWKTFIDAKRGISFRYPETLGTTYMRAYDWPPQVAVIDGPFECVAAGSEIRRAGRTEPRIINGRTYCVTKVSEGAAGSIYTQYAYAVGRGPRVLIFTATVRATQCGNYNESQRIDCERERNAFTMDGIMDRIIQTASSH